MGFPNGRKGHKGTARPGAPREIRVWESIIRTRLTALATLACLLSACGSRNFDPATATAAQVAETLPEPTVADLIAQQREYRIGPLDRIEVSVFGVPELARAGQVDASGSFSMPLIGPVLAAGESATSLADKIAVALGERFVRNPQVNVVVTEAISQQVTVEGSVVRPGQFPILSQTSLLRAVAIAGGTTEFAKLGEVLVFRTVGGQRLVARFDLNEVRGARADDPEIFGNDVIVVGDDRRRRLFRDVLQAAPILGVFYQIVDRN